ncbi:MAG: hypothetical protein ABIQ27_00860 [Flavobacterium sp.]|uniref:hypothetical protein n=1 Tax=Flavobacterium sp. TaxID=239 RepID=UPI003267351A
MQNPDKEQLENWSKDPKNWKLGNFYFNKEDKRVFVDKSNPEYGISVNFASPKTYLVLLICFLFFGFILYMINKNK